MDSRDSSKAPRPRPASRWLYLAIPLLCLATAYWSFYPTRTDQQPYLPLVQTALFPCDPNEPVKRVAIIGAGSAGTSAAYYIKRYTNGCNRINITVYERNDYIGGRSTTVDAYDDPAQPVELGASIFVKVNRNLVSAVERFGLSTDGLGAGDGKKIPNTLGVYTGEEWVYRQSSEDSNWWTGAKLLWKYGLAPIRTRNLMKETTGKFFQIYDAPHFPFSDLSQTVYDVGLTDITASTGEQYLMRNNIEAPFSTDIIQASTRVNYAQNLDTIHGLETMVCMATSGAMSVRGGNWQIFSHMLSASGATVHRNTSVTSIAKQSDGSYDLISVPYPAWDVLPKPNSMVTTAASYDTVILASPLQYANLTLSPPPLNPPPTIPYVHLHVTLFTSPYTLNPLSFQLHPSSKLPKTILTTPNPQGKSPDFYSISTLRTSLNPATAEQEFLYKIFSPEPMSRESILSILYSDEDGTTRETISWILRKEWNSYPIEYPRVTFEDVFLQDEESGGEGKGAGGLWYTSGIESFISTMETSSLMGMNVAKLVTDGWRRNEEGVKESLKEKKGGVGGEL